MRGQIARPRSRAIVNARRQQEIDISLKYIDIVQRIQDEKDMENAMSNLLSEGA